jgi:hypothetical protein
MGDRRKSQEMIARNLAKMERSLKKKVLNLTVDKRTEILTTSLAAKLRGQPPRAKEDDTLREKSSNGKASSKAASSKVVTNAARAKNSGRSEFGTGGFKETARAARKAVCAEKSSSLKEAVSAKKAASTRETVTACQLPVTQDKISAEKEKAEARTVKELKRSAWPPALQTPESTVTTALNIGETARLEVDQKTNDLKTTQTEAEKTTRPEAENTPRMEAGKTTKSTKENARETGNVFLAILFHTSVPDLKT